MEGEEGEGSRNGKKDRESVNERGWMRLTVPGLESHHCLGSWEQNLTNRLSNLSITLPNSSSPTPTNRAPTPSTSEYISGRMPDESATWNILIGPATSRSTMRMVAKTVSDNEQLLLILVLSGLLVVLVVKNSDTTAAKT